MLYRKTGPIAMKQRPLKVIHAAAIRDATGINARPGAVLVEDGQVIAAGEPESLPRELVERAEGVDRKEHLLLPGFVNAHTHLELTPIGPQPYDTEAGFMGWVSGLRGLIADAIYKSGKTAPDWYASGIQGSCIWGFLDAGVVAAGDICQSHQRPLLPEGERFGGQSYIELFGLGPPFDEAAMKKVETARMGLQPHAPYSAGRRIYDAAARSSRPVSTHLAETQEETQFVKGASGPMRDYLEGIGRWDPSFEANYSAGLSPVEWMKPHLESAAEAGGWLVAHCNYVSDPDISILADTNTSVAYCPIASEYFGHENHRYRDMIAAGVNVCLGTDSILCQPPDEPQPLGLLAPIRRLFQRDHVDAAKLLALATINGAKALRLAPESATLQPGADARFVCIRIDPSSPIDPLAQAMGGTSPAEPLWLSRSNNRVVWGN